MPAKPEDTQRVIANARAALDFARGAGIPVIHVILVSRRLPGLGSEGMVSPFWKAMHAAMSEQDRLVPGRKSTVREHNVEGSPGTEIIPELYAHGDYVIDNKKRLDCFYGTDLRQLLEHPGREERRADGHQHQHLRAEHLVHGIQLRLPRGRAVRLRRQHVRRRPARPRAAERRALLRLGDHERAALREDPRRHPGRCGRPKGARGHHGQVRGGRKPPARAPRPALRTTLVSIPTDTLPLEGAFHKPAGGASAGAVLLFHGNTMNFYVGARLPGRGRELILLPGWLY
jgi:hypothetical protein